MIDKNDGFYKEKYFVCKNDILFDTINNMYNEQERGFLKKFFQRLSVSSNEYLVVNQDEPYAEEIYNIIKQNERKQIIAFVGRAGSGKDYQSKLLVEKGYTKVAFADALRTITARVCKINEMKFSVPDYYENFKRNEIFRDYTGREVMENIGSAIREIDSDFWIRSVTNKILKDDLKRVCISDMRYLNEYKSLKQFAEENDYEFKVIFCNYYSPRYQLNNNHESARLANYFADHNYKDLQELTLDDMLQADAEVNYSV